MELKELRFKIHPVLYKRFKVICAQRDLSIPKQAAELIRKFVETMEDYEEKTRGIKDKVESS